MRKGQTPAVTAVLITSVIVGSVATAYVWGAPLLEKQQAEADLESTKNDALEIRSSIVQIAESGGQDRIELELDRQGENVELNVNEEKDFIEITANTQRSPYPLDTWTLLEGKSFQNLTFGSGSFGLKGTDLPGVVGVRPVGGPDSSIVTFRIEFRNLKVPSDSVNNYESLKPKLTKIDLETAGRQEASSDSTLIISRQGTEEDRGDDRVEVDTGETLSRDRTVVDVDIR